MQIKEEELVGRLHAMRVENTELTAETRRLLTDQAIERVARDFYGFCAPDEASAAFDRPARSPAIPSDSRWAAMARACRSSCP